ncbi:MAG TPA: autotransporter domain-containing protein [Sphingomicrobium sp.]|nr:autotransporter domain-containing protein [Sphingomicrobium sp.]
MRCLLVATALTPVALGVSITPASAETVVSTAVTTPVLTGTANDDLRISSTGSVKPATGAAVTINSNDSVKNEGAIAITGANGSTGILANTNLAGNITNTGTITIDENFTPTDTDSDGDLDGPFAQGNNRFGIHVLGGGTFTGNIINSGTITVEGNQSAGIAIDSALTGSLSQSVGAIMVTGNDSFGIKAGDISGNVALTSGSIKVQGGNSVGVALDGNVGGSITIQNAVSVTGYRSTTAPADPSKLDADDLLQGGPAVRIAGNVAGGIVFDAPPADNSTTDTDEDDDGILDAQEGTASIASFGAAPAILIGSTSADTAIGASASSADGHGLVVKGTVAGFGVYKNVAASGIAIGGLGHAVTIAGGMTVAGTVTASAVEADATALRIGSGASVPELKVTGSISAQGAGTDPTKAQAILIEAGANVVTIRNSGVIQGIRAGTAGTAAAIVDKAGTVNLIENSGVIGVADAATLGDKAIAFDLAANSTGVTVRQLAAASGKPAPTILGTMLFGGGSDILDVADGTVIGAAKFGLGNNQLKLSGDAVMTGAVAFGGGTDSVQLAGTSVLTGNVDFGGGADSLALTGTSAFHGALANSAGLGVNVGAGTTFDVTNLGTVNLASLTTGAGSTIGVSLDQGANAVTFFNVTGAADFGTGTKVQVNLRSLGGVAGTYKIVQAGTLTGAANLSATSATLPFLYGASLITTTPGEVSLNVRLKTASELGLNASEASILNAVIGAADSDAPVAGAFLGVADSETLRASLQQMLPEHAGGAFENVTKGSRLIGGILSDPHPPVTSEGGWGLWAQQVAFGTSKSIGSTSSYDIVGWGAALGLERSLGGAGNLGVSLAYLSGKDHKHDNELMSSQYEGSLYWRANFGHLHAFARGTAATINFDGTRVFNGVAGGSAVSRTADGKGNGKLYSASGGLSYEIRSGRFTARPNALVEYYRLKEKGYAETGGGSAFDLIVDGRTSDEAAASASLALGYDFMGHDPDSDWLRLEIEGGRRQILSGSLGNTVARFAGGQPFTLTPEERTDGWRGGIRLAGGGTGITIAGEVNAEQQQGHASLGGRLGLQFNF